MGTRWVIAGYGLEYGHFFCVLVTAGNFFEKKSFFFIFLLHITLGNEVFLFKVERLGVHLGREKSWAFWNFYGSCCLYF